MIFHKIRLVRHLIKVVNFTSFSTCIPTSYGIKFLCESVDYSRTIEQGDDLGAVVIVTFNFIGHHRWLVCQFTASTHASPRADPKLRRSPYLHHNRVDD